MSGGGGGGGGYRRRSMRNGDLEEEEVWSVMERDDSTSLKMRKSKDSSCGSSSAWRLRSAPKTIPRANHNSKTHEGKVVSSSPVNIPDWSKIYGKSAPRNGSRVSENVAHDDGDAQYGHGHGHGGDDDIDNDDDDDDEMVPPHEWIAKKLARSQISSFSVCEGIGRTLKGRDLSEVRNTILTKTGFLE
ncbi:Senescence_reg domain-containing protein [Cephalotus follicularis]|uniref:Senescence_reg domain-containing protein n=1 Tax=Cephalotus follicularis TaxID=3775 RepID=A0A1Q3CXP1_CEPFO|nr:Senescence_reg domain-containing protein [Cephalotus follicularis]